MAVESETLKQANVPGSVEGPERPKVGYLVRGEDEASMNCADGLAAGRGSACMCWTSRRRWAARSLAGGRCCCARPRIRRPFMRRCEEPRRSMGFSALAIDSFAGG